MDLPARVAETVGAHPAVDEVKLVGSRAEGRETALSDWDFLVETRNPDVVAAALPELAARLDPLAAQWDRLSEEASYYMLLLRDGTKVDLVLDRPPVTEPPWVVDGDTLAGIDAHFWDWILWLGGKQLGGRGELVRGMLGGLMFEHLLAPLGVSESPATIAEAVAAYLAARSRRERELGVKVDPDVEAAVLPRLRAARLV